MGRAMAMDNEPVIRVIEAYYDLEAGQAVEARLNDVGIPAGTLGAVVRRMPETGNWQCVFELDGGRRRVVSLTPDQLRPAGGRPAPVRNDELQLIADAHDPVQHDDAERQAIREERVARLSTEEAKARRKAGLAAYHERRRAEKEAEAEANVAAYRERCKIERDAKAAKALASADEMLRSDAPATLPEPALTPEQIEEMRTSHDAPRQIRGARQAVPQEVQGEGFAEVFLREHEAAVLEAIDADTDWLAMAESALRRVMAGAAQHGTWDEMAALWEAGKFLAERRAA